MKHLFLMIMVIIISCSKDNVTNGVLVNKWKSNKTHQPGCVEEDWYMCYDYNGDHIWDKCDYLYTEQTGDCAGENEIETGGGGTRPTPEPCCVDSASKLESGLSSETIADLCGGVSINPTTQVQSKTCVHSWYCSTNTLGMYSWKYISYEETELKGIGGGWKFKQKPAHKTDSPEGQLPPCVRSDFKINVSIGSLNKDSTVAAMNITYSISVYGDCLKWNRPETVNYNASSNWRAQ